jgi:regulator of sigma E protease
MDSLLGAQGDLIGYAINIVALLVALTIIVFIHEYGHFKVARMCGMKVDTFSIGFGREVWGRTDRYGTRWKIGYLPFGGYVKFTGDANAASMPDPSVPAKADEFHGKPVWQRALVVFAGPAANFILAFFLFAAAFYVLGDQVPGTKIGMVQPGSPAEQGGLKVNDVVKSIDAKSVESFNDIVRIVTFNPGKTMAFVVDRQKEMLNLTITARAEIEDRGFYGKITVGRIGISFSKDADNFHQVNLIGAIKLAGGQIWFIVENTLKYVGKLFLGQDTVAQLGGVGSMAKLTGDAASNGVFYYIATVALLSVSIGLINLFPIPMLDGGHLVFYAIEAIRRKPLGPQAQEWSFRIGFALVILLMLIGNWNDLVRAFAQS